MMRNEAIGGTARPDLTELAAAEFVGRHGRGAPIILEERAVLADQLGHAVAARTWRTMAAAAARALHTQCADRALPVRG
jgi:hypothetical protein